MTPKRLTSWAEAIVVALKLRTCLLLLRTACRRNMGAIIVTDSLPSS
jgi:hypothetical protein